MKETAIISIPTLLVLNMIYWDVKKGTGFFTQSAKQLKLLAKCVQRESIRPTDDVLVYTFIGNVYLVFEVWVNSWILGKLSSPEEQ